MKPLINENWFSGIRRRLLAFAVVFIAGLLLILYLAAITLLGFLIPRVSEVLPELLDILPDLRLLQIAQFTVLFISATLLFGAIYKILPDVELGWRDVTGGGGFHMPSCLVSARFYWASILRFTLRRWPARPDLSLSYCCGSITRLRSFSMGPNLPMCMQRAMVQGSTCWKMKMMFRMMRSRSPRLI